MGDYKEGSVAGTREDIVLLRLDACAGAEYAGLEIDRIEENQKNPPGNMMIVSSMLAADRQKFIGYMSGCRSTVKTPGAGLVATSCETVSGMSGSMLIAEDTLRIVGLNVRGFEFKDGTKSGIAVSAKYLNEFLDEYFAANTAR